MTVIELSLRLVLCGDPQSSGCTIDNQHFVPDDPLDPIQPVLHKAVVGQCVRQGLERCERVCVGGGGAGVTGTARSCTTRVCFCRHALQPGIAAAAAHAAHDMVHVWLAAGTSKVCSECSLSLIPQCIKGISSMLSVNRNR
jgi:hypothetical protein